MVINIIAPRSMVNNYYKKIYLMVTGQNSGISVSFVRRLVLRNWLKRMAKRLIQNTKSFSETVIGKKIETDLDQYIEIP